MVIPNATRIQLQQKKISHHEDLVDFDDDSLKSMADNIRRPRGRVLHPTLCAGATIHTPPFIFGPKSQVHLKVAAECIRYYETVGRELRAANLR